VAAVPEGVVSALPLLPAGARRDPDTSLGYLDLLDPEGPPSTGRAQDLMLTGLVPRIYERWWRPALGRIAKGPLGPSMGGEVRLARSLLHLHAGDGVLDVACGPGNFTRSFARAVGDTGLAVGIDASPTMLRRAVADGLAPQLAYVRGDAVRLPFRDASFDAVCCFAALHLFAQPQVALDHMTRVLTPGGRIALMTSAAPGFPPLAALSRLAGAGSGMAVFSRGEVAGALRERGFEDVHRRTAGATQFVSGRKA
jgi:SAM-dependent methyltransferase